MYVRYIDDTFLCAHVRIFVLCVIALLPQLFAQRQTFWDLIFTLFDSHNSNVVALIIRWILIFAANFTAGMISALFFFAFRYETNSLCCSVQNVVSHLHSCDVHDGSHTVPIPSHRFAICWCPPCVCVCVYMYVRVCVCVQARVLDLRVLSKSDIRIDILRHRFAHTLVLHVNA